MKSQNKETNRFEEKLARYRHRMELVRTIIGFVVLCIQIWLFFHITSR